MMTVLLIVVNDAEHFKISTEWVTSD